MKRYNVKTILLPTDFSETSSNALFFAIQLAKKCKAKLVLIHVVQIPVFTAPDGNYVDIGAAVNAMLSSAKDVLKRIATNVMREHKVITDYCALQGQLYENIIRAVHLYDSDLIVMGTGHSEGLSAFFFGSNTFRIINHSPVPVLTINEKIRSYDVIKIIFPVSENRFTTQKAKEVIALSRIYQANVMLVGIITDETKGWVIADHIKFLDGMFLAQGIGVEYKMVQGMDYAKEIIKICANSREVMVAVAARQDHSLIPQFFTTYDEKVVSNAGVPVLSVPVN